jgi:hypothetical protein
VSALELQLKTPDGAALRRMLFAPQWTYILSVAGSDLVHHDQSIKHFLNSVQIEATAKLNPGPEPEPLGKLQNSPDVPADKPEKRPAHKAKRRPRRAPSVIYRLAALS